MITIPNFGKLSQEETERLLQQLMEYTSLHALLHKTTQEAYLEYIHGSLCVPPHKNLSQDANDIYNFFEERIDDSCLIIQDIMLRRCREAIKSAESQRNKE